MRGPLCSVARAGLHLRAACAGCSGARARRLVQLGKRQPLYLEGQPAEHLYAVVAGHLRESCATEDGRLQGVRLVGPGGVSGFEALRGGRYRASAETLTRARLCVVPRQEVLELLGARPEQALRLLGAVVDELSEARDALLWVGALRAEERVLALLGRLAGATRQAPFRLPITRLEMADLLGLSHSTVSRSLHRLADDGAIELDGRQVRVLR